MSYVGMLILLSLLAATVVKIGRLQIFRQSLLTTVNSLPPESLTPVVSLELQISL
jgi:hypothetical protein